LKSKIKNNLITLIGLGAGALGGFLYWKFIGCATVTCPLTSNWAIMLVYGALTGGLIGNVIQDKVKDRKVKNV
jgi:hypothetical protein